MPNPWRVAKSLLALRDQINALSPNRSKAADGTIGDAAHASRSSDHNPHIKDGKTGVVTGMDITNDPYRGVSSRSLAQALLDSRDPRIKYVISDGEICSGSTGPSPWKWRKYTGKNSHHHHVHLSVMSSKALYDSGTPWKLNGFGPTAKQADKPAKPEQNPLLVKGNKGFHVERLQKLLNAAGAKLTADADFGGKTEAAVKAFQKARNLVADGIVGPATWAALGG